MRFSDLAAHVRRDRVKNAVDGVLRQADVPLGTGELVKAVTVFLDAKDCQGWIARTIVDLTRSHPQARQTGETFIKYGKPMGRWEWLPLHKRNLRPTAADLEARRQKIAAIEGDEWTVHPEPPKEDSEEFLDE